MSNVFQLMNHQFPNMFKSPSGENSPTHRNLISGVPPAGQKVVCTPEVSLYQYTATSEMAAVAAAAASSGNMNGGSLQRIMEEKGLVVEPNNGNMYGPSGGGGGSIVNGANGNGGFQCGACGKTFQQKNTFQNHLRSHREGDDPYQCDICGKTFAVPARLTRHYRTHTGEKPYQCEYCNKSFSVKENLSVHRRIHTKERPYKCEVCERAFEHSGKLHRHMRIHTGERPHRCQICQKTFIQSGQLVIHMRTHTGEKPYVCKVCGKGFTCSKQLKVHTRTHTGEKPYTCDICGKSFGYNHVLKLHQVAHYGEKVYKCTLCNGTFNSKKALETHIKTHSDDHVPSGPGSPNIVTEPGVMSPSSISQATPQSQNSDKENRECSDSELSSQNSPSSSNDGPKTPPSPPMVPSYPTGNLGSGTQYQHPMHLTSSTQDHKLGGFGKLCGASDGSTSTNINSNNNNSGSSSNSNIHSGSGNNNSSSQDKTSSSLPIPYPMLPPGVQIQQAPHSRTTFLYVTSKLPPHPTGVNSSNSSSAPNSVSSPPHSPPLSNGMRYPQNGFVGLNNNANSNNANGKQFSNTVIERGGNNIDAGNNGRNKMLMHKIREKVLQFTEKYGYGLSPAELEQQQQQNAQKRFIENGNLKYSSSTGVSVHPVLVPENLSFSHFNNNNNNNNNNSKVYPENGSMYHQNRLRHHQQQFKKERSSSPEIITSELPSQTSYTPGGVLALALTKGSKAVAAAAAAANNLHHHHNIPAKVSLIPVTMPNGNSSNSNSNSSGLFNGYHNNQLQQKLSPRSSSPGSPVDFHHHLQLQQQHQHQNQFYLRGGSRPESVSPTRNSLHSPSPNSTARSTPSLQDDYSDQDTNVRGLLGGNELSGDEGSNASSSSSSLAGSKRSRSPNSNSSGGGPRKRSSLILEKYAMENPATPALPQTPPSSSNGSESILSQRLRLSSVIQYAEKCS